MSPIDHPQFVVRFSKNDNHEWIWQIEIDGGEVVAVSMLTYDTYTDVVIAFSELARGLKFAKVVRL